MPRGVGKEYAGLINPTRKHAPTEYNLQYKRWPQHPGEPTYYPRKTRGKLVQPGRLKSAARSSNGQCNTIDNNYSSHHSDQASFQGATCGTDSYLELLGSDKTASQNLGLLKTLKTCSVKLHERPQPSQAEKLALANIPSIEEYIAMSEVSKRGKEIRPSRNAWMPEDEGTQGKEDEDDLSARLRYLSFCSNVASTKATATSGNSFASNEEGNVQSPRGVRALGDTRNKYTGDDDPHYTSRQVSDISKTNDWSYYNNSRSYNSPRSDHNEATATWRSHSPCDHAYQTRKKMAQQPRKSYLTKGIEENSLRKIYVDASEDELKSLRTTFNGLLGPTHSRERVVRKQHEFANDPLPKSMTERKLTRGELNEIRASAFRTSQRAAGPHIRNAWCTSYNNDYCNKWFGEETSEPIQSVGRATEGKRTTIRMPLEEVHEAEQDDEITSIRSQDEEEEIMDEDYKSDSGDEGKPREKTASEKDRIVKEADIIEDREFKSCFRKDGKPKMKFETTFGHYHKGFKCKKPEKPVWAHETMVTLGSGHWNVLLDHYDGWETGQTYGKYLQDSIPSKRTKARKYKIRVTDRGDPSESGKQKETDDKKIDDITYTTEYMRRYHQMPLPKKIVLK